MSEPEQTPILDENGQPMSKNALKKKQKAEEAAKKKAEKEAAKKEKMDSQPKPEGVVASEPADDTDPRLYFENRTKVIYPEGCDERNPNYPHKFNVSIELKDFIAKYSHLQNGEHVETDKVSVGGRIMLKRAQSAKLVFYDIHNDGQKIQLMCDIRQAPDQEAFISVHNSLRRGDWIGAEGFPGKTKRGELTLFPSIVKLLSPCLHMMPREVKNPELRHRMRELDIIFNPSSFTIFDTRTKIVKYVREFLDTRNFREVETPILNVIAGGAAAKPFVTHHNQLDLDMFLRIAPELYLKRLIVAGMNRVYEIGRLFRNEGIDLTHNPEFTTCEFYAAFLDYNDLMEMTEEMVNGLVKRLFNGKEKVEIRSKADSNVMVEVDFSRPFRRIHFIPDLEKAMGVTMPADLGSEETTEFLKKACKERNIEWPNPPTTNKLLDTLAEKYLEPHCLNPTFICDHPAIMSPLAKYHRDNAQWTERFELFVNFTEWCNAYTELNDPIVQRKRFEDQAKAKAKGDEEATTIDEYFCRSLEYGLPPTAGWGMGIDRLAMMLSQAPSIQDAILFPTMKPEQAGTAPKKEEKTE
ncbi:putative Lysine--tRNA ligase [Blattamonas nauphoetae]|uniref:Lysine--tRNA ligase n=1 Tax=Blattamonas nauphoetae TaxID=2049346 RepID=A0ABQ9YKN3_9EUKA|nr:putative Lysine--tRNA ligase [Blattamonas nauphoetae]